MSKKNQSLREKLLFLFKHLNIKKNSKIMMHSNAAGVFQFKSSNYNNAVLKQFLVLLNPFAPHVSEEIFEILGFNADGPITSQSWPKYEQNFLSADTINIAVQINGKTRGVIELEANLSKETIIEKIIDNDIFKKYFIGGKIIKEIYVPNRLVNFVINDK